MNIHHRKSCKIEVVAIAEDEATGEFLAIIEFRNIDGVVSHLVQPKSALRKVHMMINALDDAGAILPRKEPEKVIRSLLLSADKAPRWKFAPTTGWYDGHRVFVHPDRVIGKTRGTAIIKPPRIKPEDHNSALAIQGSHKNWLQDVAAPARYSSRMVLGCCAALGAPLLDFVDLNSFGILVYGPGKSGKSTLLVVAGSVIGFASERDLVNFRTTDAALGEIPAAFNHMLLPINELGLLKGSTAERNQRLQILAYGFAEGRGTTYSTLAGIDKSKRGRKWRSIALANGEEATDQISGAAGETRMTGASIRWIDLPATRKGAEDIFDLYRDMTAGPGRRSWVQQHCKELRKACRKNHGVAIEHFVEGIIKNRRTIKSDLLGLINSFVKNQINDDDDMAVRHLATCFGLIAAAGILGVRFKTLTYSEKFVLKCIQRCYRDARRALRTESNLLRQGLRMLRNKLHGSGMIDLTCKPRPSRHTFKTSDGYIDRRQATIRAERFKSWFKDPRQPAIVLKWIHSKNALKAKGTPPTGAGTAILWAESQPKWPRGTRPRSIVIDMRRFRSLEADLDAAPRRV